MSNTVLSSTETAPRKFVIDGAPGEDYVAMHLILRTLRPTLVKPSKVILTPGWLQVRITGRIFIPAIPHVHQLAWDPTGVELPPIRHQIFKNLGSCGYNNWGSAWAHIPAGYNMDLNELLQMSDVHLDNLIKHLRKLNKDITESVLEAQRWAASFVEWEETI